VEPDRASHPLRMRRTGGSRVMVTRHDQGMGFWGWFLALGFRALYGTSTRCPWIDPHTKVELKPYLE